MNSEQELESTLLALAGETAQALKDARYEEAITLGREALAELLLDTSAEVEVTDARLEQLAPVALQAAGDVLTALAISTFRSGDYLTALRCYYREMQRRRT